MLHHCWLVLTRLLLELRLYPGVIPFRMPPSLTCVVPNGEQGKQTGGEQGKQTRPHLSANAPVVQLTRERSPNSAQLIFALSRAGAQDRFAQPIIWHQSVVAGPRVTSRASTFAKLVTRNSNLRQICVGRRKTGSCQPQHPQGGVRCLPASKLARKRRLRPSCHPSRLCGRPGLNMAGQEQCASALTFGRLWGHLFYVKKYFKKT